MAENKLDFPFEYKELEPKETAEIKRLYNSPNVDYVRVGPKGFLVFRSYINGAAGIYNMPVRSSDIFVVTFQRSGTTWTQELVWLIANDFDYATAKAKPLTHRYPFLDIFMYYNEQWTKHIKEEMEGREDKEKALKLIDVMTKPVAGSLVDVPSPRYIKSHLPLCLLPPTLVDTAKVVYVARDPRDVAVSGYHMSRLFTAMQYAGTFKEFWTSFMNDLVTVTPFFEHVKEAWEKRHHPNMLFLFYEELSKDLPAAIQRVSDFLDKPVSPEEMDRLCDHLSIDNFRKNKALNFDEQREYGFLAHDESFIRKGKAGGWRDYFDEDMTQQAERWMADNLRDTDLRFPHLDKQ